MCVETDEETKGNKKESGRDKALNEKTELPQELPDPGRPPKPPVDAIPLPVHVTGIKGDPLQIQSLDELVDIDLSEMSGK